MRNRETVSLNFELAEILDAVEGGRALFLLCQNEPGPKRVEVEASMEAVLSLAVCRLRLLRAVLAREVDPLMLLAPHNAMREEDDPRDIQLVPWGPAEVRRHAEALLERVGRLHARGKAR